MHKFTKYQLLAFKGIWQRSGTRLTYLEFRRLAYLAYHDCMMINTGYITLGIETDGHTHS